jgi:hypothetical protein
MLSVSLVLVLTCPPHTLAVSHANVSSLEGRAGMRFEGLRKVIKYSNLSNSAFQTLEAGKSIEIKVDIASVHNLSAGGMFHINPNTRIPIAAAGSNDLAGSVPISSNNLVININGFAASQVRKAVVLTKRAPSGLIAPDCTGARLKTVQNALARCAIMAAYAAQQALLGPVSKFEEYFGYSTDKNRRIVSNRYAAVGEYCLGTKHHPDVSLHCVDEFKVRIIQHTRFPGTKIIA